MKFFRIDFFLIDLPSFRKDWLLRPEDPGACGRTSVSLTWPSQGAAALLDTGGEEGRGASLRLSLLLSTQQSGDRSHWGHSGGGGHRSLSSQAHIPVGWCPIPHPTDENSGRRAGARTRPGAAPARAGRWGPLTGRTRCRPSQRERERGSTGGPEVQGQPQQGVPQDGCRRSGSRGRGTP